MNGPKTGRQVSIRLNAKKLYRLYKEERLTVRKRGGRKRALDTRAPMTIPQDRNLRWSLDFVPDTLVSGRRFRIMTLVDDFTRECLGLVVDTSLTGMRVARELDRIAELRNYPCMIVSDNGTELTSTPSPLGSRSAASSGTTSHQANRCRTGSSRASTAGFATSASTSTCSPTSRRRQIIEEWRIDYNTNRPHSSLNGLTPTESAARPTEGHNRSGLSL
jgi:putative transposase